LILKGSVFPDASTNPALVALIALTGDYRIARAAYEAAIKSRPGRIVTLRQKTRLLAESRPE
jgi:hypothetical protein